LTTATIGVLMVHTPGTGVTRDYENAVMQAIVTERCALVTRRL